MEASKLREFEEMCRKHDWTYEWSDDPQERYSGASARASLEQVFKSFQGLDHFAAVRIWNTHAPADMQQPIPKSVYLSGKISGLSPSAASKKFMEVRLMLKGVTQVINPFEIGLPDELRWISEGVSEKERWERHMDRALDLLRNCDCIYMLDNWKESTGAIIEIKEAISHNIRILGHVTKDDIAEIKKVMQLEAMYR